MVGSPVVAGSAVYVADRSGVVRAFGTGSDEARWTVETGQRIGNVYDEVLMAREGGSYYDEDAQAVLPGDGILYISTREWWHFDDAERPPRLPCVTDTRTASHGTPDRPGASEA